MRYRVRDRMRDSARVRDRVRVRVRVRTEWGSQMRLHYPSIDMLGVALGDGGTE